MDKKIRLAALRESFLRLMQTPGSKAEKMKDAFIETLESGLWRPDDPVPTEKELLAALPVSQGTIQAAMRRLAEDGIVVRKRGSGSRISTSDERGRTAWFMRFRSPERPGFAAVRILTAELTEIREAGPWSRALGARPSFVRLERKLEIGGDFTVLAVAYLDAGRFRPLLDYSQEILAITHIRHLLHDRFNAPTLGSRESLRLQPASAELAEVFGVAPGTSIMTLETTNLSLHDEPFLYQEFHVPPNDLVLDLPPRQRRGG